MEEQINDLYSVEKNMRKHPTIVLKHPRMTFRVSNRISSIFIKYSNEKS